MHCVTGKFDSGFVWDVQRTHASWLSLVHQRGGTQGKVNDTTHLVSSVAMLRGWAAVTAAADAECVVKQAAAAEKRVGLSRLTAAAA